MEDRIITYGGQAVIEGVLMRGQKSLAIAMRNPKGEIVLHTEQLAKVYRSGITKIPFLRGRDLVVGCAWTGHARPDHLGKYADGGRRKTGRRTTLPDHGIIVRLWHRAVFPAARGDRRLGGNPLPPFHRRRRRIACPCTTGDCILPGSLDRQPGGRCDQAGFTGGIYLGDRFHARH